MSDYIGQIKGFPKEVIEKMLEKQVEQGNPRDVKVFEYMKYAGNYKRDGRINSHKRIKGFEWAITIEGWDFWNAVIMDKNFGEFYKLYPI